MADRRVLVEVISPEQLVYSGEADMVVAPGVEGELGIMPLHIPVITELAVGELRVKIGNDTEYIAIQGGFMEVREDRVSVLAEHAAAASQIDPERARTAKEKAEADLREAEKEGHGIEEAQRGLEYALTQLRVVQKRS